MMRRHLFAVMGDLSMTLRDLFAVKCDLRAAEPCHHDAGLVSR